MSNNILTLSSPAERADRLKLLRGMANLSRKALCEGSDLNENTVKGWEFAIHGGLTVKGAEKIIQRLKKAGIACEQDWLLYGQGHAPSHTQYDTAWQQNQEITTELAVFKQHYLANLSLIINDDGMLPHYQPGDCVAGPLYENKKIAELDGQTCIVQLEQDQLLLRVLRQTRQDNVYNLFCLNLNSEVDPVMSQASVLQAAPVIWHRKQFIGN